MNTKIVPVSLMAPISGGGLGSGTTNGTAVETYKYTREALFTLHSAAGSGTDPTLDVKLQHRNGADAYEDITGGVFSQVTDAASLQTIRLPADGLKEDVRAVAVVGGSNTPKFAFSVLGCFVERYQS